jgi:hypothetical protein
LSNHVTNENHMKITSVNHLTLSIGQAYHASASNKALGGLVVLAKGNDDTSIVIKAQYTNRREKSYRAGYVRFGHSKPIWCFDKKIPLCPLTLKCDDGSMLDEKICREVVNSVTDMANATNAIKAA